jgi:hypothetical protein
MNRRHLLKVGSVATVTGLAGCTGVPCIPGIHGGDPFRRVTISSRDDVPADHPLTVDLSVVEPTVTTDHTAALELTVGWTGTDSTMIQYSRGNDLVEDTRQPSHVVLLADYYMSMDSVRPSSCGCWEINPNTPTFDSGSEGGGGPTLDPGESISDPLYLWGTTRNDCLPTGRFRFDFPFVVDSHERAYDNVLWGFEIRIREV